MQELDFEKAYQELEEVVKRLEAGEATLEESLALFEKGVNLVSFCNKCLDQAEGRIRLLLDENGPVLKDMEESS